MIIKIRSLKSSSFLDSAASYPMQNKNFQAEQALTASMPQVLPERSTKTPTLKITMIQAPDKMP
jgi:hypothetical protein